MEFTQEQVEEMADIDNIDDLLKIFIGMLYISNIPYADIIRNLEPKFDEMLEDIF